MTIQNERQHTHFGMVLRNVLRTPNSQSVMAVAATSFMATLNRDHVRRDGAKKATTLTAKMVNLKEKLQSVSRSLKTVRESRSKQCVKVKMGTALCPKAEFINERRAILKVAHTSYIHAESECCKWLNAKKHSSLDQVSVRSSQSVSVDPCLSLFLSAARCTSSASLSRRPPARLTG